ncbi:MAG TPA: DUF4389 domain-containing protein, partial [Actinomycetales bacterium]|nr:DUF4389 domain-containing protein [Actinomycetales bacterium]
PRRTELADPVLHREMSEMTATLPTSLPARYPVRVDAQDYPNPSRLLWLVKWAAAIPHYIVLAFLWVAFVVLSMVAFVAIVVTGRYPKAIFDFNVGVLRWSWRVTYYAYGALGTDQYPPFSLSEDPDYPAHLDVDYPEHLSRGLVLVKWWLLALPHYIVVGILIGGGAWAADRYDSWSWAWRGGLIGLLALIAAVILMFTGRYPQGLYDLVLGLNRWVLRVAAYASLMTDTYPPFRLDSGPHEPDQGVRLMSGPPAPAAPGAVSGAAPVGASGAGDAPGTSGSVGAPGTPGTPPAEPPAAPPPAPPYGGPGGPKPPAKGGWSGGRVVSVVLGAVLVLTSLGLLTGGVATLFVNGTMRDGGYVTSLNRDVSSSGYAVVVDDVVLEAPGPNSGLPARLIGDVRVRVHGAGSVPVFVGIARSTDVNAYLGTVQRDLLQHMNGQVDHDDMMGGTWGPGWSHRNGWGPMFTQQGTEPSGPPTAQQFWSEQASGAGDQSVVWTPREGSWALVVMNADGSQRVNASVDVGATVPWLPWLGGGLLILGAVVAVAGALLILVPVQRVSRERR